MNRSPTLLTIGQLFAVSFLFYRQAFWTLIGYSAWIILPVGLVAVGKLFPLSAAQDILILAIEIAAFPLAIWIDLSLLQINSRLLFDQPIKIEEIAAQTKKKFGQSILAALVVAIVQIVGLIFLIVPGIIVSIWYVFIQQEIILNNKKWLEAFVGSRELVRGYFAAVFWRLAIGGLFLLAGFLLLAQIFTRLLTFLFPALSDTSWVIDVFSVFFVPLLLLYVTTLYFELKRVKSEI